MDFYGCEALGFCPFNNCKEGFPCPKCPYAEQGGYSDDLVDDWRNIDFETDGDANKYGHE